VETPGPLETPCWLWPGARTKNGYGGIAVAATTMSVHRLLYRVLVGEPPAGRHLHHLCETPGCANPAHLAPLTVADHIRISASPAGIRARQTVCIRGHELAGKNLSRSSRGTRRCLACHRERERERYLARAA
jgi:hypothetical protein